MKTSFYPKLAWEGIRKNKRLYFPYMLTGSVMVMMFYILSFLSELPALLKMSGGAVLMSILPLGSCVIGFFSLLFLFYTNSFLIRQRNREFGLYNVLGMDKRNISKIMFWECIMVGVTAICSGLIIGIALSKLSELVLLNLLGMDVDYEVTIGVKALCQTLLIFGLIYFILLMNSLIKVAKSKPLQLLKSNKVGEKLPKRIWFHAVIGVVLLGIAYYLAVSIEEPLAAFTAFFIAVILVIAGTYELFIAGSVAFCKLLQKSKKYYYQPNHFVSVSSMVYRMRRNGAGLASICILLTMVLVMISSTASLYFGKEEAIRTRYPSGVNIQVSFENPKGISDENIEVLERIIMEKGGVKEKLNGFREGEIPGLITEEGIMVDPDALDNFSMTTYNDVGYMSVISLDDYNRILGTNETLSEKECLVYCNRATFNSDTFTMENGKTYQVKKVLDELWSDGEADSMVFPTIYVVVDDFEGFVAPALSMKNSKGEAMMKFRWKCGFDLADSEKEMAAADAIRETFGKLETGAENSFYSYNVVSRDANRASFLELYGSLFFLGIMLSIVFLFAAVLIIYYKQISEGYEDQSRFGIMQKVGMTKREIRSSINSQMLTVFFLPLIVAGIHLCFSFSFIWKILMMFGLNNMPFVILAMLICFVISGIFYAFVYKITSNAYFTIVSTDKKML